MSDTKKFCVECGLELPADWRRKRCGSSARHACWSVDELNKWRNDNGILTYKEQGERFLASVHEVGAEMSQEHKMRLFTGGYLR